jgi:hypothetical protein
MFSVKASIVDVYKKLTKFEKSVGVIYNGIDNLYPERVDRFINNSVTAKTCSKIMASYLTGKGWGPEIDKIIVNKEDLITVQRFTSKLSNSVSKQRGAFIHVNYDLNYKPCSYDVLPYTDCRLGKKDDDKYNGKIGISQDWDKKQVKKSDILFFDVFNPKENIVKSQIDGTRGDTLADKLKNYKGQILYVNFDDEYTYALSQIDAVMNDCDSEAQASVYKNRSLRKGFFGKTLVITKPLAGGLEDYNDPKEYYEAESERTNFKDTIKDFIGAENVGDALHIEMEFDESEKLEDVILFKDISASVDDKLFAYTETSVFNNILMAFNSIPPALVRPENSVFSASGESIKNMQTVYQDNTINERNLIKQTVQYLMSIFCDPIKGMEMELLIKEEKEEIKTEI